MKKNKILALIAASATALSVAAPLMTSCNKPQTKYTVSCASKQQQADLRKTSKFEFQLGIDNKLPDNYTIYAENPTLEGAVKISKCNVEINSDRKSAKLTINTTAEVIQLSPGLKTNFNLELHIIDNDKIVDTQTISSFILTHQPQSPGSDNVELTSEKDVATAYAEKTATFSFYIKELNDDDQINAEIQLVSGATITQKSFSRIPGEHNFILTTEIGASETYEEEKSVFKVIINCTGGDTWTATFDNLSVTYTPASKTIPENCLDIQDGVLNGILSSKLDIAQKSDTLRIPKSVTEIKEGAFKEKIKLQGEYSFIKNITFPSDSNLKKIGDSAFEDCSLYDGAVFVPSSVTSIGKNAFKGTSVNSLLFSEIESNDELTIGDSAFEGVASLVGSLTIPSRVSSIGKSAFEGCTGLSGSLTIKSSETRLLDKAFKGCYGIDTLDMSAFTVAPTNWTSYQSGSTEGSLAQWCDTTGHEHSVLVIFNDSISSETMTAIGDEIKLKAETNKFSIKTQGLTTYNAFTYVSDGADGWVITGINSSGFSTETTLFIPEYAIKDGVTKPITQISDNAFYSSGTSTINHFNYLYFSSTSQITRIGANAFRNAKFNNQYEVGSLTIPNSVTTIGDYAFADAGFKSAVNKKVIINLSSAVTTIGKFAFANTSSVVQLNKNQLYIGDNFLPNGITKVQDSAFLGCIPNTTTFKFPKSLQYVESEAFHFDWTNKLTETYTFDFTNYDSVPLSWTCETSRFIFVNATEAANLKGTMELPPHENDWDQYRLNQTFIPLATCCGFYNVDPENFKANPSMTNPSIYRFYDGFITSFALDGNDWMISADEIKKFLPTPGVITFPEIIKGESVLAIGANAFNADEHEGEYYNINLKKDLGVTKLIFKNNIQSIGDYAFKNSGITEMDFTALDASAFSVLLRSGEETFTGLPTSGTIYLYFPKIEEFDHVTAAFKSWPELANWKYKNTAY